MAVDGEHPDTRKPYSWHGGEPWSKTRDVLPYVREADVCSFLDEAAQLLVAEFGFQDKGAASKQKRTAPEPKPMSAAIGARSSLACWPARICTTV